MSKDITLRILAVLAIAMAVTGCGSDEPAASTTTTAAAGDPGLVGQWERAESSFSSLDGMIIEVRADGAEAVIVTVPDNEYQFVAGDVKWSSIEPTSDNEYTFQDLVREEGSGDTSHVEGVITITDEGTLEMTFPTTGTVQEWVRVEG